MFNLQPRRSYFNGLFSLLLCASLYTVVNCAQSGVIESPNYPGKYTPNVVSRFHLTPDNSTGVFLLTFVPTFDVEGYEFVHCAYDWVAIYTDDEIDGLGDTCDPGNVWVKNSGVFCNHHLPDCQFWLRADRVVIEFCSDSIVQGLGFGLVWETESALTTGSPKTRRPPVPGCGFIVKTIIAGDRFHLKTPNYPDPYPADIFCNWVFTTEIGYHFQIVSQFFETQPGSINGVCTTDDLLISDPFGNSKTDYCGTLNIDIVSKGRAIDLKFYSNGDPVTFQGFDLIIASVTDHPMTALPSTAMPTGPSTLPPWQCGVYNTLMSLSQKIVFESQGYPSDYPIFFSCKYHFQSPLAVVNPRYRYKFTVLDFKTELQWDTLSFFDGATGAPLVSWSGDKLAGYSEMLDAPTVEAVFESDGSTSFRGFQVEVELIETECKVFLG